MSLNITNRFRKLGSSVYLNDSCSKKINTDSLDRMKKMNIDIEKLNSQCPRCDKDRHFTIVDQTSNTDSIKIKFNCITCNTRYIREINVKEHIDHLYTTVVLDSNDQL